MRMWLVLLLVLMWGVPLFGCSVGMALSGEKDPDLSVLRVGESRGVIEMQLKKSLRERVMPHGSSYVTYEYTLGNQPSAGRAVAHGVMDVLTLGLWEVAGTPIEAGAAKENVHQVTVLYDRDDRVIGVNDIPARRDDEVPVDSEQQPDEPAPN